MEGRQSNALYLHNGKIIFYNMNTTESFSSGISLKEIVPSNISVGVKRDNLTTFEHYAIIGSIPLIAVLGTLGNLTSIWILLNSSFRKLSIGIILVAIAFGDTVQIYINELMHIFISEAFNIHLFKSVEFCNFAVWAPFTFEGFVGWMIVVLNAEHVILVCFPHKAKIICTKKRAIIVTASLFSIIGLVNIRHLRGVSDKGACKYLMENKFDVIVAHIIALIFHSVIPSCIMLMCNVTVILKLRQRNQFIRSSSCQNSKNRMGGIFIAVTAVYFLTTFPFILVRIIHLIKYDAKVNSFSTSEIILNILMFSRNASCFPLYCATGSAFWGEICSRVLKLKRFLLSLVKRVQNNKANKDSRGELYNLSILQSISTATWVSGNLNATNRHM